MIIELVDFVVVGVFDEQIDRIRIAFRGLDGFAQDIGENLRPLTATTFIPGPIPALAATSPSMVSVMPPSSRRSRPREYPAGTKWYVPPALVIISDGISVYATFHPLPSMPPRGAPGPWLVRRSVQNPRQS